MLCPATATGRFTDQRGFCPLFEHDERMAHVDMPLVGKADQTEKRSIELHPFGHVKQRPTRPKRGVKRREDVVRGLHGLGQQIPLQQLGVVFDGLIQIDENRPPEARCIGLACQRAVDVLDASGVVRAQRFPEIVESPWACAPGFVCWPADRRRQAAARGYQSAAIPRRARWARRMPETGRTPRDGG